MSDGHKHEEPGWLVLLLLLAYVGALCVLQS
jgi:hypothetical protein